MLPIDTVPNFISKIGTLVVLCLDALGVLSSVSILRELLGSSPLRAFT